MPLRYLLFDLDETLYPRQVGIMQAIGRLIQQYIVEELGYSQEEAMALRRQYYQRYGTTMRGLILHHDLDADHFLAYVHNFPLDNLQPNPQLDALLATLPGEKVIFTNADRDHAERILNRLGVHRHFSRIIDVVAVGYISKPAPEAYANCLQVLNAKPTECVLIEDSARNLEPAAQLGMATVLVDGDRSSQADYYVASILDIGPAIKEIYAERDC